MLRETAGSADNGPVSSILVKARDYGRMVRFSHSVFALPFALASVAFASLSAPVTVRVVVWVVIAVMLVWGAHAFRRSERAFADII